MYTWTTRVAQQIMNKRPTLDAFKRQEIAEGLGRMARDLTWGIINFAVEDYVKVDRLALEPQADMLKANGISSLVLEEVARKHPWFGYLADKGSGYTVPPLHKVVLDLDMDALLIPSTTPGRHHLIIDHTVQWKDYVEFLEACVRVGILEPGYVQASIAQGATWIRTPWTLKTGHVDHYGDPKESQF